jgi:hypothetical protein
MCLRFFFVFHVWLVLFCSNSPLVQARSIDPTPPFTTVEAKRALKLARWLWSQAPQQKPFLHRDMPLLNLERWLVVAAALDREVVYKNFLSKARQLGYKAPKTQLLSRWQRQWRRLLLAADAKRWKMSAGKSAALSKRLKALSGKLTIRQKRQQRAWLYLLSLSQVPAKHRKAIQPVQAKLTHFLHQLWLPATP